MNLGVLFWRLGIGERHLPVPDMTTDVIDAGGRRSIGQYNDPDTRFRIVSDECAETSGASLMPGALSEDMPRQTDLVRLARGPANFEHGFHGGRERRFLVAEEGLQERQ